MSIFFKRQASIRTPRTPEQRAECLLESQLTPEQVASWRTQRYFDLITRSRRFSTTAYTWRIERGNQYNVQVMAVRGRPLRGVPYSGVRGFIALRPGTRLCVHPRNDWDIIPVADTVLAQKLLLETSPEKFIRLANWLPPGYAWRQY